MKGVIYILGITPLLEAMKTRKKEDIGTKEGIFYFFFSLIAKRQKSVA